MIKKIFNLQNFYICALSLFVCACGKTVKQSTGQGGAPRMDLNFGLQEVKKKGFTVPPGAGREFQIYRAYATMARPTIGDDNEGAPLGAVVMEATTEFMNQKLGFVKRIKIYNKRNTAATAEAEELAADGEIELRDKKRLTVDWFINGKVVLAKAEEQFKDQKSYITYKAQFIVEVKDRDNQPIDWIRSSTFSGEAKPREVFKTVDGKFGGGWSETKESAAVQEAVMNAMSRWMTYMGNELPVTGKITNINEFSSSRLTLDQGVETGLSKKSVLCIWYKSGNDKMPVAIASCEPGSDGTSSLVIPEDGWNTSGGNEKFRAVIESIQRDGNAWFAQNQDKLYATSWGVPLPDEWGGE